MATKVSLILQSGYVGIYGVQAFCRSQSMVYQYDGAALSALEIKARMKWSGGDRAEPSVDCGDVGARIGADPVMPAPAHPQRMQNGPATGGVSRSHRECYV